MCENWASRLSLRQIVVDRSEEPVIAPLGTLPVWVWCPARFIGPKYFDLTDGG